MQQRNRYAMLFYHNFLVSKVKYAIPISFNNRKLIKYKRNITLFHQNFEFDISMGILCGGNKIFSMKYF